MAAALARLKNDAKKLEKEKARARTVELRDAQAEYEADKRQREHRAKALAPPKSREIHLISAMKHHRRSEYKQKAKIPIDAVLERDRREFCKHLFEPNLRVPRFPMKKIKVPQ